MTEDGEPTMRDMLRLRECERDVQPHPAMIAQVDAVRWRLMDPRQRLKVRFAASWIPMPVEQAVTMLFRDFDGDVSALLKACESYHTQGNR